MHPLPLALFSRPLETSDRLELAIFQSTPGGFNSISAEREREWRGGLVLDINYTTPRWDSGVLRLTLR